MSAPSQPTAIVLAISGLILNPSTFDPKAANGSLTVANNVVIDRPSVVATRRGFSNDFVTLTHDGALSLFQYNNYMLINTSDDDMHAVKYDVSNNPYLTTYTGIYSVPDGTNPESRVRGIEVNKNFYFITQDGTYRLDHIDGEPRRAGAPAGLSGTGIPVSAPTTGFLPNNTNIAYRIVFGYKDYNEQLVLGAPSSRIIVKNTLGNAATTTITFQIPKEIQSSPVDFFFQVYRGNASPDLATQPDDEMALCYEGICTGTTTMSVDDITGSNLLGASLYTNQGQDGILQSNYRPPWALDICTFKQYAFYANTRSVMNAPITLIAAGASNGAGALQPGDTITFTATESGGPSFLLTAVSGANNEALGWFNVSNTTNPAFDIQTTAMNIALVANAYAGNTFIAAYYTSSDQDLPGQLRFDRLTLSPDAFTVTSSRPVTCWNESLPITSVNDARANRIYYSKFNQPEAVPIVNYIEVGSANQPIRRVVPLRDGVMVLKDDGVFRISNAAPPFTVTPIDYNVRILAANTAAELDNKVYFLSDQGVVALSDSDAQIMSFVLDRAIIENTSPDLFPNLRSVSWGIAYQSDRKYILFMPQTGSDTQATQQYVYNHLTQLWTRWTRGATCGLILKRDGKFYMGSVLGSANAAGDSYVYQERKTFTNNDYADNQYTVTSVASTTSTLVISNPVLPPNITIQPGWSVAQPATGNLARIVSVTVDESTTLVLDNANLTWNGTDVILYTPILSEVQTIQLDCDNPAMNKQFSEIVYIFTEQGFTSLAASISSNTAGIPILDTLIPTQRGGWGNSAWGTSPWGGGISGQGKIRRYVPQAVQRAGWLYLNLVNNECFTSFGWSGIELHYKQTSTRQK
jgi:hypothetical protein